LVALWVLDMPQLLILLAAGAGIFLARRWYRDEQRRIAAELARARKTMDQQEAGNIVRLERDPATGVYSPKPH
jgi:hypothetical protein